MTITLSREKTASKNSRKKAGLSEFDKARFKTLWEQSGCTTGQIRGVMGWKANNSVNDWVHALGLRPRAPYSPEFVESLRARIRELESKHEAV